MRPFLAILILLPVSAVTRADDKLDDGLDNAAQKYAVFVRMENQLFRRGGDYESFCETNAGKDRRKLRQQVLASLREKSDASWDKIKDLVGKLEGGGDVDSVQRYWIVNGFACRASGQACRQLADDDAVSFVYRQRLPNVPLHARPVPQVAAANQQQQAIYERVLEQWTDDADEPVVTDGFDVSWNVRRIKADEAWMKEKAAGKGIVIALCDTGLMVTPSLVRALWKNPKEKLNGQDDDHNGYVDDLFGYDFNVQSWYALGDGPQITHGSMCGGIIAGRPLNKKKLITGIAPRSHLMVLRGMGHLKAYEYALANGADVMSMSYMWIGRELGNYRGLYRLAHEHLAAGGIVAVGGAGNFSRAPAGKQIALPKDIPCVIAAAGILEDGSKAPAGSEGPCSWSGVKFYDDYPPDKPLMKPDVTGCFGGYPVWGRPFLAQRLPRWQLVSDEGDGIGLVTGPQGNSFSGPHAAGVAALMLSANPALPAWKVKQLMEQSCRDIGDEGRDKTFGAGLLDAAAAVRLAKQQ